MPNNPQRVVSHPFPDRRQVPFFTDIVDGVLYIAQGDTRSLDLKEYRMIHASRFRYFPLCKDFGPLNMSCVIRFIELINAETFSFPSSKIVVYAETGRRALANAAFLLGAYLLIQLDMPLADVLGRFSWADASLVQPYRDATNAAPDFVISLADCFSALARARSHKWILAATPSEPTVYGRINVEEYEHYDDPWNGDLHEVPNSHLDDSP